MYELVNVSTGKLFICVLVILCDVNDMCTSKYMCVLVVVCHS